MLNVIDLSMQMVAFPFIPKYKNEKSIGPAGKE